MKVDAFLFAAGLGTRLYPLTERCPKALVQIGEEPLLYYSMQKLSAIDVGTVYINVHHFSHQVVEYISAIRNEFRFEIEISDESEKLLDTGGAIKRIAKKLNRPLLLLNVDILFDLDLNSFVSRFDPSCMDALLAVKKRKTSRYLVFEGGRMCGWKNIKSKEVKGVVRETSDSYAFSGLHIIGRKLLHEIACHEEDVFSIIDFYVNACEHYRIFPYAEAYEWFDVGKYDQLDEARRFFSVLKSKGIY